MTNFAIGVDLGGTNLRIAAVDENGLLLEKVTTVARLALGRDQVISDMCDAIRQLATKFKGSSALLGVGVGIPGIIDLETGLLRESPNLPGWSEYPVREDIERRLNAPVILENDANAAALGEKWLGAARDVDDMAILTLGTGVGGGLVLRGRIWHGMTGMAGEFGHITVDPHGPRCKCGNIGCVEMFASATAVVRMARDAIASGKAPQLARAAHSDPEFSAKVVYNLAVQGDQAAREIFRQVGIALGVVVGDLVNALNLPMYVIGGGVASAWDAFSPSLFEELLKRSMVYAATAPAIQPLHRSGEPTLALREQPSGAAAGVHPGGSGRKTIVTCAVLGSDAGMYGAARLPMLASDPAWDCEFAEGKRA
jgi:glucokinase